MFDFLRPTDPFPFLESSLMKNQFKLVFETMRERDDSMFNLIQKLMDEIITQKKKTKLLCNYMNVVIVEDEKGELEILPIASKR